jgi:transcriptional regulator with XRE-family HTH domain
MGSSRPQTVGLAEKLCLIRTGLGLTQAQMVERLQEQRLPSDLKVYPGNISRFEKGLREPPPLVLLAYARAAKVSVEILIDVDLSLPNQLRHSSTQKLPSQLAPNQLHRPARRTPSKENKRQFAKRKH